MKPATKIIIFLVVVAIIIGIITFSTRSGSTSSSAGTTSASHETINPDSLGAATTTSATYTLADVAKHKTPTDCWTTVSGSVYNLTPFVNQHPGGVENITKICGIDGTSQFMAQHSGDRAPQQELATLKIGTLAK